MNKKIRVLIAKPGLDGHDRGIKVVSRGLRDAGMEGIYLGLRLTPEQIAESAIQEGVDVVGMDCLSGAHMALFPRTVSLLKEKGGEDIPVDEYEVIVERSENGICTGVTPNYIPVKFDGGCERREIVNVKLVELKKDAILGQRL